MFFALNNFISTSEYNAEQVAMQSIQYSQTLKKRQWRPLWQSECQSQRMFKLSSMWRSTICGRPLPEWTDFEPAVAARQTHVCPCQPHCGLHPAVFFATYRETWTAAVCNTKWPTNQH